MRSRPLQGLIAALGVAMAAPLGADVTLPREDIVTLNRQYLHDPAFRARRLLRSTAHAATHYAAVRDKYYEKRWARLDIYDPKVSTWGSKEPPSSSPIEPLARTGDPESLARLGAHAFTHYPTQEIPFADAALSDGTAERYGLDLSTVVSVDMPSVRPALTCASCHSRKDGAFGPIVTANDGLDLGALIVERPPFRHTHADALLEAPYLAWGKGRIDVTTSNGQMPLRIPDLRPVRWQQYLQASGAVAQRDPIDLALRIETLLITAHNEAVRPPREVALGLALYLWTAPLAHVESPPPGAFEKRCAGCHRGEGMSGGLLPAAKVAGDTRAAFDDDRGTGRLRVPSLVGVASRGPLLHDASVASVDGLLDPARRGGHRFGLEMNDAERREISRFLQTSR